MLPHYLPTVVRKHQAFRPQQFLYFLPLPQGQGSLGYTFAFSRFTGPFGKESSLFVPVIFACCSRSTFCSIYMEQKSHSLFPDVLSLSLIHI